jgi:serine/threonine-protein kinase RsbT
MDVHRHFIETSPDRMVSVISAARLAQDVGFDDVGCQLIATTVSELCNNILKYATGGQVTVRVLREEKRQGIEIEARDRGPGIDDPELAMTEGVSSGGTLGLGLPGVQRMMDEFWIETSPNGTVVRVRKWRPLASDV